ncbi:MAG TPA: acetyl-coenzyme A synthetase N-terminal domain-containing protein, partial [Methylovirgula sp.]|nr:acetyl-coenzyme A synthetase N-terminal domain-containing protein [Methylovirgula sp.]
MNWQVPRLRLPAAKAPTSASGRSTSIFETSSIPLVRLVPHQTLAHNGVQLMWKIAGTTGASRRSRRGPWEEAMLEEVYPVHPEWARRAHIDAATYEKMYAHSLADPEGFWGDEGRRRIAWIKPFTRVKNA